MECLGLNIHSRAPITSRTRRLPTSHARCTKVSSVGLFTPFSNLGIRASLLVACQFRWFRLSNTLIPPFLASCDVKARR